MSEPLFPNIKSCITHTYVCEIAHLVLHTEQLYCFHKHPDCGECYMYDGSRCPECDNMGVVKSNDGLSDIGWCSCPVGQDIRNQPNDPLGIKSPQITE